VRFIFHCRFTFLKKYTVLYNKFHEKDIFYKQEFSLLDHIIDAGLK